MLRQLGGLQKPTPMPNTHNTCVLDAYLNSILNSHALSKWAISRNPMLKSKSEWNGKFGIFYEKLLSDYVKLYYTTPSTVERNTQLNDIRISMEYLHNAKAYEREIYHRTLNSVTEGMSIAKVDKLLTKRAKEYKDILSSTSRELNSSGSVAQIIRDILENNRDVIYTKNKSIGDIGIADNVNDIFIYHEYEGEINADSIREINDIYNDAL